MNVLGIGVVCSKDGLNRFPSGPADLEGLESRVAGMRRTPRYVRLALLAALRALDGGSFPLSETDSGLVVATAYGCKQMALNFMDSILDAEPRLSSPTAFSHSVNNVAAGLLSLHLGIHGPCCTVSQFGLSFAGALEVAGTMLDAGRANSVLVGAVDEADARFNACCTGLDNTPDAEGAVFLHLGNAPAPFAIDVHWERVFAQENERTPNGESSLPHAFGTALALQAIQRESQCESVREQTVRHHDSVSGRTVLIHIRRNGANG